MAVARKRQAGVKGMEKRRLYRHVASDYLARRGRQRIAAVGHAGRFDQHDMRFTDGARAVLHAARDDVQLTRGKRHHAAVFQVDFQRACQHQKKVVRVGVNVPVIFAAQFGDHDIVAVEQADGAGGPGFGEGGEFCGEVDGSAHERVRKGKAAWCGRAAGPV
jgi:hypothetical protein